MDKERKKQIISEYKQQKTTGGVYRIYNKQTNKSLIKADINLQAVQNRFRFSQKLNNCYTIILQQDWLKYGTDAFAFEILMEIEMKSEENLKVFRDRLKRLEEEWKEKYSSEGLY